jgi:ligand-binding sensor domain-containing protein
MLVSVLTISAKTELQKDPPAENRLVIANNLSNQQVTSIAEDAFGHIWIGTIRGLNKFNVFEYHQYFNTNDSISVSDNRIQQIYKDSKNKLWVATVNGICLYNEQGCFDQVPIASPSKNAIYLFENNDGKLFLNLNFAIYVYNAETNIFEPAIPDIGSNNFYTFCFIDKSNQLWIAKPFELLCYNSTSYELKATYPFDHQLTFAFLDERDVLWLNSWNQIKLFDTKTSQYITVPEEIASYKPLEKAIIVRMYPYNSSSTLIQTQNDGIFLYNHINGSIVHQSENGFPFEVPNVEITTFLSIHKKNC